MEACIILDCSTYSMCLVDIIKAFQQIGWNIYDMQGKVNYLPVGDANNFDWKYEYLSEEEIYKTILEKSSKGETVGIYLFKVNSNEGVIFLASNTTQIMLSISIYRRTLENRHTDIKWYEKHIIDKLIVSGVKIDSYKIEEYED